MEQEQARQYVVTLGGAEVVFFVGPIQEYRFHGLPSRAAVARKRSLLGKAKIALMRRILGREHCSVPRLVQLLKANQRAVANALKTLGAIPAGKVFSPSGKRRIDTWRLP